MARGPIEFNFYEYLRDCVLPAYKKIWETPKRILVLKGGGGSGKSHTISQKVVLDAMAIPEPVTTLVIRKVNADNRESTFRELVTRLKQMDLYEYWKVNNTTMEMTYTPNGNKILFRGLDDPERIKSISGITKIWVEEASQITKEEFDQLNIRLRQTREYPLQIYLTFNPISANHWIKRRFFDKQEVELDAKGKPKPLDAFILETTYKDNKHLPPENIEVLESFKIHSPYYYQVYCLGNWGTVGDTLFNRERIGQRTDDVFRMKFRRGRFSFEYVNQMISDPTIKWIPDDNGEITIYEEVDDMMPYVVGIDTAGTGIDKFAAHVLNNFTEKVVAQYHGKVDEKSFADQMYCLGKWYNEAMLNVETNFSTYVVNELARMEYPNLYRRELIGTNDGSMTPNRYGFVTTKSNRNTILSLVDEYLKDHIDKVDSLELLEELSQFVIVETSPKNRKTVMRAEAAAGAHDDLVMALGITLFTRNQWDKHTRYWRPAWKSVSDELSNHWPVDDEVYSIWN